MNARRHSIGSLTLLLAAFALVATMGTAVAQETAEPTPPPTVDTGSEEADPTAKTPVDVTPGDQGDVTPKLSDSALRERIVFLLSGYEFFPSRDDLDEVAPTDAVIPVLVEIVRDTDARPMHRLRAVDALGFYPEAAAGDFLSELLKEPKAAKVEASERHEVLMRHHAITALARSKRDAAIPALEPFLTGDDLQLKLTAVVAVGKHGKEAGRERLRKILDGEHHALVKREARKYLR